MKKRIVIYTVLTIVLGVLIVALLKRPAYASVQTTYQAQFGYYTYQGTAYPIDTLKQKNVIDRAETDRNTGYRQKEILVALGIVPDEKADLFLVGNVLSRLNVSAGCEETVKAINSVTGCYDLYFEQNNIWEYELMDGSRIDVYQNGEVVLRKDDESELVIFCPGKGYREEGWE